MYGAKIMVFTYLRYFICQVIYSNGALVAVGKKKKHPTSHADVSVRRSPEEKLGVNRV
jgi:hypothetical protein